MPCNTEVGLSLARDIVVIGGSAGGIEALTVFVANVPGNTPVTMIVVVHIPSETTSSLPLILGRASQMPALHAHDGDPLKHGHIYVAPPDFHLLITANKMRVVHGPRVHRHRPAIDPLFCSAALHLGRRVVGIILSGALNDGAAGMLAIKRAGGITMVQDPITARFPGMPESVLSAVEVDRCLPPSALAREVVSLACGDQTRQQGIDSPVDRVDDAQISKAHRKLS
jgi:two-component system chemotaxis response regulator CheB